MYVVLELLLSSGVDLTLRDSKRNTALHYAVMSRCEPAALMLLERISEPELIDATNADLRTYGIYLFICFYIFNFILVSRPFSFKSSSYSSEEWVGFSYSSIARKRSICNND